MSSSWWCLLPACQRALLSSSAVGLGVIVLSCYPPDHSGLLHVSLHAQHEVGMRCSPAWLERIFNSAVLAFCCIWRGPYKGWKNGNLISIPSFWSWEWISLLIPGPSQKLRHLLSKEQCEQVTPVHTALHEANPAAGWIPSWPPLSHWILCTSTLLLLSSSTWPLSFCCVPGTWGESHRITEW